MELLLVFSQEYQFEIVIYWFHVQIFWYCPSKPCPHTQIASTCTWISSVSAQTTCLHLHRDIVASTDFRSSRFNSCPHHWVAPVHMWNLCVSDIFSRILCVITLSNPPTNGISVDQWNHPCHLVGAFAWLLLKSIISGGGTWCSVVNFVLYSAVATNYFWPCFYLKSQK